MTAPLMSAKTFLRLNAHPMLPPPTHHHLAYKVLWTWDNSLAEDYKDRNYELYEKQKITFPIMYNFLLTHQRAWFEVNKRYTCADIVHTFEVAVNLRKMKTADLATFKNILDTLQIMLEFV